MVKNSIPDNTEYAPILFKGEYLRLFVALHPREYSETQNPFFELQNYTGISPLVVLDPSFYMIKNITQSAHRIGEIQQHFYEAYLKLDRLKQDFMNELQNQLKTEIGVKKDYFLNYFKVESSGVDSESKILDLDRNIFEDILGFTELQDRSDQIDTSEDGLSAPLPIKQEQEVATDPEQMIILDEVLAEDDMKIDPNLAGT